MNETAQPLIKLEAVNKVFYTEEVETHALSDVHFDIHAGDYFSIEGPSGCGKSTLLAILGLLDTATGGRYFSTESRSRISSFGNARRFATVRSALCFRRSI